MVVVSIMKTNQLSVNTYSRITLNTIKSILLQRVKFECLSSKRTDLEEAVFSLVLYENKSIER